MAEHVMQRVANFLNLPNEIVRRKNLMKAGDVYPLGQRSNVYIATISVVTLIDKFLWHETDQLLENPSR